MKETRLVESLLVLSTAECVNVGRGDVSETLHRHLLRQMSTVVPPSPSDTLVG